MSKEVEFFVYLLERYTDSKGMTGADALAQLDAQGITNAVIEMYEIYHVERLENAFEDIDLLLSKAAAART